MANQFLSKLKESCISLLPIILLVVILNFTPLIDLSTKELIWFLVASVIIILGIALFSLGADISMTPMGKSVGNGLTKKRKLDAEKFFGISIHPDKQIVLMVISQDKKEEILSVLYDSVGISTEAQGIAFSIPVDGMTENLKKQLFSSNETKKD